MGNPAGDVQDRRGGIEIERVVGLGLAVKEIARMVQRHNDHNQAPQYVDGLDAAFD